MGDTRQLRLLTEELCCPACGGDVTVEHVGRGPVVWHEASYRVRCAAGDYERELTGREVYRLEGVALKAA